MKKVLFTVSALALAGFMFTGCEEELGLDACLGLCTTTMKPICHVNSVTNNGVCGADCSKLGLVFDFGQNVCIKATVDQCKKDTDCELTHKCNMVSHVCEPKQVTDREFKFVRVDDTSEVTAADYLNREDPGADIDAVVLKKAIGGQSVYAVQLHGYNRGNGKSDVEKKKAYDPQAVIGAPDSFTSYPDATKCQYYVTKPVNGEGGVYSFVSLGGKPEAGVKGGYVIVEMGGKIEVNDMLDVLEVGNCKLSNTEDGSTPDAKAELVQVSISISNAVDGSWVVVGSGKGIVSSKITADHLK